MNHFPEGWREQLRVSQEDPPAMRRLRTHVEAVRGVRLDDSLALQRQFAHCPHCDREMVIDPVSRLWYSHAERVAYFQCSGCRRRSRWDERTMECVDQRPLITPQDRYAAAGVTIREPMDDDPPLRDLTEERRRGAWATILWRVAQSRREGSVTLDARSLRRAGIQSLEQARLAVGASRAERVPPEEEADREVLYRFWFAPPESHAQEPIP